MRILIISFWINVCLWTTLFAQDFAEQSVLNEGSWYKIGVTESGIYKLDQSFFTQIGLSPANVDPRNIKIYGNGGAVLPQSNAAFRHDDLVENAIFVSGEADGAFNVQDFVLFYGESSHTWQYDAESQSFHNSYHPYADTNYYFLTVGNSPGKRMDSRPSASNSTFEATTGKGFHYHEIDSENLIKSGRNWLGEKFDLIRERDYNFPMPDLDPNGKIIISLRVAARSDIQTSFQVSVGNKVLGTLALASTNVGNYEARHYWLKTGSFVVNASDLSGLSSLNLLLSYNKGASARSEGWLDWIEINYDQIYDTKGRAYVPFSITDEQLGTGQIAELSVANGNANYLIWDITDPTHVVLQEFSLNGNNMDFAVESESARRFVAFTASTHTPVSAKRINNQNLHGLDLIDYLVITAPAFKSEAQRLAQFHQEYYQRSIAVITPEEIYNEFSSGKQDVSAIRDFIRMLYIRSNGMSPGFVTLFGDGSYIYKYINDNINNTTNYVPAYQSRDSWDPTSSYTSDDYYGFMDKEEGFWGEGIGFDNDLKVEVNQIDVPIGRLPIENLEQATQIVDKIITYVKDPEGIGLGSWRNRVVLVADHKEGEGNTHVRQADGYQSLILGNDPCIHLDKIYMDNYAMVKTAGVTRFPEGREALLDALDQGSLIVNYTGHGGEQAWSNSRILENTDILKMKNAYRNPAVITATCEFGRYDDPAKRTGAEIMVMTPEVGAIALFTTVRLVYSSPNETLNQNFYREVFTFDSTKNRMPTLGEIMMRTKNRTFVRGNLANINSRNFTLLGDPGVILNYPKLKARITEINDIPIDGSIDTLKSLALVKMKGVIEDELGAIQPDVNGEMDITVFDKPSKFTTRLSNFSFFWEKNRIFNGRSTVKDGTFNFEFVVPIDISYEIGNGKASVYFFNDSIDGSGCYSNLYVGGTDITAEVDDEGPELKLYINDTSWVSGGITDKDPFLYAIVSDQSGINTVGSGIGHEIIGVLDEDESQVVILNEYYSATKDNYREGTVRYQLRDLEEGEHTLRIRVWDVANNSAEATTNFIVTDNARIALDRVLNYPNPFAGETRFMVGHNQSGEDLSINIEIFTAAGQLVKTLSADFQASGNNYRDLSWDGTTDAGMEINPGVYIYRVYLKHQETGREVFDTKRMVLIK